MKPMKGKSFLDTNILLHCYSENEPAKKDIAIERSEKQNCFISTQVLQKFTNILRKKFNLDWDSIRNSLQEITSNFIIHVNQTNTIISTFT